MTYFQWVRPECDGGSYRSFEVTLWFAPLSLFLCANVASLRDNLDDDDFVIRNDTEFHQLISEAAKNSALSLSVAPVGALLFSATVNLYSGVPQAHKTIMEAIIGHDAKTAEKWMARHIRDFRTGYEILGVDMHAPITLHPRALEVMQSS